jgi:hypothetical protein
MQAGTFTGATYLAISSMDCCTLFVVRVNNRRHKQQPISGQTNQIILLDPSIVDNKWSFLFIVTVDVGKVVITDVAVRQLVQVGE